MIDEIRIDLEQFFFDTIASAQAAPQDYRTFFEALWREHGERVFGYAFSRLRNEADARDICQSTFVNAMEFVQRNPQRVPLRVNFRGWLRVIARNLINDRFRRVLVRPAHVSTEAVGEISVHQPPEDRAVTAEDLAILSRCLDELTERSRSIVLLREVEGQSEKRIAEKLGSTANAVCVALHRARKALRECVSMGYMG